MDAVRKIRKVWKSRPTVEGAGVHLKRAFGYNQVPQLDPFLLLDDFRADDPRRYLPGFPWHPHRGIETITYVIQGLVEHGDSLGNEGVIRSGDVQWMTAGSGIIHQEMPKGDEAGRMWGFQLWANLPAERKMMEPRYRDVRNERIPEMRLDEGIAVRIICGQVAGTAGPIKDIVIDPEYLVVTMPPRMTFTHPVKPGHTAFAYVVDGRAYFARERNPYDYEQVGENYFDLERDCRLGPEHLVLFDDGPAIEISTEQEPVRFLFVAGRPLREPVAWYGPIVMNTQEELRTAFEEYQRGTFIKQRRA